MAKGTATIRRWCLLLTFVVLSLVFLFISFVPELPDVLKYQKNIIWSSATTDLLLRNVILANRTQALQDALNTTETEITTKQAFIKQLYHKLDETIREIKREHNINNRSTFTIQELQTQLNDAFHDLKEMKEDLTQQTMMNKNLSDIIQGLISSKGTLQHQLTQQIEASDELQHKAADTTNTNDDRMTRYKEWTRGIGDVYLSNDISSCAYPEVSDTLSNTQVVSSESDQDIMKQCEKQLFSNLYTRTLTVYCDIEYEAMIAEFDDIFHSTVDDDAFTSLVYAKKHHNSSLFVVDLNDTTQITWVKCGDAYNMHMSLINLEGNDVLYQHKKERIHAKLGVYPDSDILPPNIIIFVVDSISRSQFIRSAPMITDYLSNLMLNPDSQSTVLEWFRYSTVGYGHRVNLAALSGGTCVEPQCIQTAYRKCIGLSHFYDKLGYYVPGFNDTDSGCDVYLSTDVFPDNCLNMDYTQQFILQCMDHKPSDIPYFMMIDSKRNAEMTDSQYVSALDKYLRDLIENIDKSNTILHIISANGAYNHQSNIYGAWEANNPVSVMILPQYLVDKNIIDIDILSQNQQKHINHYDIHLFYKELMLQFMEHTNGLNVDTLNKYKQLVVTSLPKVYAKGEFVFSESIMNGVISDDRSCDFITNGYCFCDVLYPNTITKQLIKDNTQNVRSIMDEINNLTGNGEFGCVELDVDDFQITMLLSNAHRMHIVIRQTPQSLDIKRESVYRQYVDSDRILTYSADIDVEGNNKAFNLLKINSFSKHGKCLRMDYGVEEYEKYGLQEKGPLFVNKRFNKKLITKKNRKSALYDLRLCHCKQQ